MILLILGNTVKLTIERIAVLFRIEIIYLGVLHICVLVN